MMSGFRNFLLQCFQTRGLVKEVKFTFLTEKAILLFFGIRNLQNNSV